MHLSVPFPFISKFKFLFFFLLSHIHDVLDCSKERKAVCHLLQEASPQAATRIMGDVNDGMLIVSRIADFYNKQHSWRITFSQSLLVECAI
jgi:hypothetical protein